MAKFLELDTKQEDTSGARQVDSAQINFLWQQKYTNTTAGSCCGYLNSRLLGMGFKYMSSQGFKESEEFSKHIRANFIHFSKSALEALLVQGFVVYSLVPRYKSNSNLPYPFVHSPGQYTVQKVYSRQGYPTLEATSTLKKGFKLKCFTMDMPTDAGALTSRMALVSKQITYLDEVEKNDIQAYSIRARPPVLTKNKTDISFDSRDVIGGAVPGFRASEEEDHQGVRNQITVAQFRQQQQLIKTLNEQRINTSSYFWTNKDDPNKLGERLHAESSEYTPRFVPLPNDADICKFDLPEEKKDLVHIQKYIRNQICMGMGVPEHFISPSGTGAGFGEKSMRLSSEYMRMSISPLKEAINALMTRVYHECFLNDDDNLHEVECYFPSTQNSEMILELYKNNMISKETFAEKFGPMYDLTAEDFL